LKEEQDEEARHRNRAFAAFGWAPAWAQVESKREAGMPKVTTSQITGEVVYIEGNYLIAKMQPSGGTT
jgi:hypothetical protein